MSPRCVKTVTLAYLLLLCCFQTRAEDWPAVFDPFRVLTINLEMDPGDWSTVQSDTSLSIEVPATMWAEDEEPIAVLVRRKAGAAQTAGGITKVALKVDVNDLVRGQTWRGLKKLSLESGADLSVLKEGFAWNLFRLASEHGVYGYAAGHAAWARVVVNGAYQGLYANVEQRDKQFLENRGMYKEGATWLYKVDGEISLEVGSGQSPTYEHLCYTPFTAGPGGAGASCPQPNLEIDVQEWVNLRGFLCLGAINAFMANSDSLFTHDGKNCYAADFLPSTQLKRLYFPWDLDTGFGSATFNIYTGPRGTTEYQEHILAHYWFRQVYRHIMTELLDGPLSTRTLIEFLDRLEPVLAPALAEDPNATSDFAELREWITNRVLNVRAQVGPQVGRPEFSHAPGEFVSGLQLGLGHTNAAGTIYYTLDGTDPRAIGGGLAGAQYAGPIILTNTVHVTARVLSGTNWSAPGEGTFNIAGHAGALKVTEIMYNPPDHSVAGDGNEGEFIELKNTGPAPINLSGCHFEGIKYHFSPGSIIQPGAFVLLIRNAAAFGTRYPGVPFHGVFWGGLSKGGEKIRLKNSDGNNIISVEYDDAPPWPLGPDGFGWSLVNGNPAGNPDDPENWRSSAVRYGSPGADDSAPPYGRGVIINEVLTHTDTPLEDAIELHNPTTAALDISGWYLSDAMDDTNRASPVLLKRYQIPAGTIIPAGGYKAFYEADFNASASPTRFAFSKEGEQAYLSSADANRVLTGYIVGAEFGAAENGVSFGRYRTSAGVEFTTMGGHTFGVSQPADRIEFRSGAGAANSGPKIGPVVINEIMYNPAAGGNEFLELHNVTGNSVDLTGWTLEGANFVFPASTSIGANSFLLLIGTTNVTPDQFRAANAVPADVPILSHDFDLQNDGEALRLNKPNETPVEPAILVDRVRYNDNPPWPTEADGFGPSLERLSARAYGNEPRNWRTTAPGGSPGRANVFNNPGCVAIAKTSSWKYHNSGSNLGTAWQKPEYSDSSWPAGRSPLGVGEPFIRSFLTNINGAPPPVTTYFRKEFVINDHPGSIIRMSFSANYDDGFVAYLNGQEVARRSMPSGPIVHSTLASAHEGGTYELIDFSAYTNLLVLGRNLLAVEVHQESAASDDLVWEGELTYTAATVTALQILSPSFNAGQFQFRVIGPANASYIIEVTSNFQEWLPLATNSAPNGIVDFTHSTALDSRLGFYRARLAP